MEKTVLWQPQEGPQTAFCQRQEFEVLYGGAAGGGKSDALLMEGLRQIHIPGYRAIYFRRTFPNLQHTIDRSFEIFPAYGGKWNGEQRRWMFPSGASYKFGHMKDENDKHQYQSQEYAYIAFDELTEFLESQYLYLHSRCRTSKAGIRCYIRCASNPGNIGHAWVKRRFIDPMPPYATFSDSETGLTRAFIPAKVYDNKILMMADPLYVKRLENLPEHERRMLMDGDWDVFAGQAFGEIRRGLHIVKPFALHSGWFKFASLDWGYSRPFSIGWWAVDGDSRLIR
ncbi:MAG: terminase large subunit domain-containing protein, partial [Candidatus Hodarchaeota archaeon]